MKYPFYTDLVTFNTPAFIGGQQTQMKLGGHKERSSRLVAKGIERTSTWTRGYSEPKKIRDSADSLHVGLECA